VNKGEVHAVMGPNGSGKSTLSHTLMGHPNYKVTSGEVIFKGKNLLAMPTEQRAKLGVFLALQYPVVVPGISMSNFLRTAINAKRGYDGKDKSKAISPKEFLALLKNEMSVLRMDDSFLSRYVNEGFSGGEKKRNEIFQMAILDPVLAVLDETDSGLDIDALRIVASGVNRLRNPERAMIVVTHYQRLLDYVVPDFVHVLVDGRIAKSGGKEMALELEERGYAWLEKEPAPRGAALAPPAVAGPGRSV
jgi:Fe-S cluster assembly ATP-binding protein